MIYLLLDLGNTRLKWFIEEDGDLINCGAIANNELMQTEWLGVDAWGLADLVFACSVSDVRFLDRVKSHLVSRGLRLDYVAESEACGGGVVNAYSDYKKLGVDRWLALLAAKAKSDEAFCVIDCGSAVTMDFVGSDGAHHGGYIMPGLRLLSASLQSSTFQIGSAFQESLLLLAPGKSTAACVSGGVAWYIKSIDFALSAWMQQKSLQRVNVYLTGGDASIVRTALSMESIMCPRLVVEGLMLQALRRTSES
ncbi:MAG: type III pantothenate kinase [Hahellaceae bacterium]|jgi:type III pantothenate kinase|nr:type III pantothenate kinase [Hahellaceae bacterium]